MNLSVLKGSKKDSEKISEVSLENKIENPYLAARHAWNSNVDALNSAKNIWQILAIGSMVMALLSIVGIIYIGSQSKYIPYILDFGLTNEENRKIA